MGSQTCTRWLHKRYCADSRSLSFVVNCVTFNTGNNLASRHLMVVANRADILSGQDWTIEKRGDGHCGRTSVSPGHEAPGMKKA
jgi:hypothetical protein